MTLANKTSIYHEVWGFTESFTERLVGFMPKGKFIAEVAKLTGSSKNWIRERICLTGSKKEIDLVSANPGKVMIMEN